MLVGNYGHADSLGGNAAGERRELTGVAREHHHVKRGRTVTTKKATERAIRAFWWRVGQGMQKSFYAYVSRRADDDVLFMNWAYEEDPPMRLSLSADDEPNRYPIQLYHATAMQNGELADKKVLEVGCGRGGGASYISRALRPSSYTGLDLSKTGIAFCRRRHQQTGLQFVQGHAEKLPFPGESFDAVINIESSHCYPNFDRFLGEVARVLRPGGTFLHADVRQYFQCDRWHEALANSGMQIVACRDIRDEVLRGMELNCAAWIAVWETLVPRLLRKVAQAPIPGDRIYSDVESGMQKYRMYCLVK